jgi:hypothetical protein
MEERCAVLATEDSEGGGAPVNSERGKVGNAAYPDLDCSNGVVDEVREVVAELWVWCSGRRCGGGVRSMLVDLAAMAAAWFSASACTEGGRRRK